MATWVNRGATAPSSGGARPASRMRSTLRAVQVSGGHQEPPGVRRRPPTSATPPWRQRQDAGGDAGSSMRPSNSSTPTPFSPSPRERDVGVLLLADELGGPWVSQVIAVSLTFPGWSGDQPTKSDIVSPMGAATALLASHRKDDAMTVGPTSASWPIAMPGSMDTYGEYLAKYQAQFAEWLAYRNPFRDLQARAASATDSTAHRRGDGGRRGIFPHRPRSSRPERWCPPAPRRTSAGRPDCGPTTGSWPTGAVTSPTARRPSSSTTGRRGRESAGSPSGLGGVLIPAVPDDCDIDPPTRRSTTPVGRVQEHGLVVNSHRAAATTTATMPRVGVASRQDGAPAAVAHDARRRVRALPG
jgi:hypothetical protein